MKLRTLTAASFSAVLLFAGASRAAEAPSDEPKPIPVTRPEIKVALEALKQRTPRLPLPASAGEGGANNGRMRAHYLPPSWSGGAPRNRPRGSGGRGNNGASTLDYALTTSCFWVVSRGNNCHYCLGHQELKLAGEGLPDERIAALDFRWSDFDPRTQAALALARKLTLEPHLVSDNDIQSLHAHFTNDEIIELAYVISRFNSTNRWTDGMGIPQDQRFGDHASTLLTPTAEEFSHTTSLVTADTRAPHPPQPTAAEWAAALAAERQRTPRVAIPSADVARKSLGDALAGREPLAWERALSILPEAGKYQVAAWNTMMSDDHLPPLFKAELAFLSAVNNRAWYASSLAAQRIRDHGGTPEALLADHSMDDPQDAGVAAARRLARKLTVDPHLITDRDIAEVRSHFSDDETAQLVHVICMASLFDRFTSALGLTVESSP